jgi:glycosyltransferase involved in cell wall biosynthesis
MRYASPAVHFNIPYVLGPHGGSVSTPGAFAAECGSAPLFTRLRELDHIRFKADPWLRRSFAGAACIIGVAPYALELLRSVAVQRFEVMCELGIEEPLAPLKSRDGKAGLQLLHVARAVRTKGLRDCIRALSLLPDLPEVMLTQAGDGEELPICKEEANRLGVAHRVSFLGRVPRAQVEELYASSDVFLFPSFREPTGGVLIEAMRHGLPVIAADRGGPSHLVDDDSGIKVPVENPVQLAAALANAIRQVAGSPSLRASLSMGARARAIELGSWPRKISWLLDLYGSILRERGSARRSA